MTLAGQAVIKFPNLEMAHYSPLETTTKGGLPDTEWIWHSMSPSLSMHLAAPSVLEHAAPPRTLKRR